MILKRTISIVVIATFIIGGDIFAESIKELDKRAQQYYKKREFGKAIAEWLRILELDQENEEAQKKIERVYEEKHKKDISFQKAKLYYKLSKLTLKRNFQVGKSNAEEALKYFIIAYRIDPNDPDIQLLKQDLKELDENVKIEGRKNRLSDEMRKEYLALFAMANQEMKLERYNEALKYWERILSLVPLDKAAKEGKRKAELAIANRLKFERIKVLFNSGVSFFQIEKYKKAKLEFEQVLRIDPQNNECIAYIDRINDILDDRRNYELKRMQADQFYLSGVSNLRKKRFDEAEEDLMNVLALFNNYKDARGKLADINRLRKEYEELARVMKLKKIDKEFKNGLLALADGNYRDAIMFFEATIILDPDNSLAKRYIESAKEALKQLREERVDENSPYYNVVNSLVVSGKLLYKQGDYIESRSRWEKILKLFPKNRIATEYLLKCNLKSDPKSFQEFAKEIINDGQMLLNERKYRRALRKFELIKSISAAYPGINRLIASAKGRIKKKSISGSRVSAPGVSSAEIDRKYKLGLNYYRKGGKENIEKALGEFKWVVTKDPDNVKALININKIEAQLRISAGSGSKSAVGKKLTDKQKRLVRVHYFSGINYYSNNNFNKAIEEWRKALAIDPTYEKARINIRKCLALITR